MNRRELLGLGTLAAAGSLWVAESKAEPPSRYGPAFPLLDRFVEQYLREMNAPGLTLALADASGVQRVCAYGLDDLARQRALDVNQLFHIGSITKSFVALGLLQLRDEGRLDLHRPIASYLPWLRFDPATRPITTHDLLTHAAALPNGPLFPGDPALRYRATAAPGTFFHYCNTGYRALGHLLAALDGRTLAEALRARLLAPLGMTAAEPVITLEVLDRLPSSYVVRRNDRPYPRMGALAAAPAICETSGDGCIAATARDMGAYLVMLANRGRLGATRLVSEAAFELFSKPHIGADEFGPGAAYGYGIAIDSLDGHTRLRHTGGMVSFASALELDVDAGVGVFASVNSMQGYRPRPVAEYALKLMRACREEAPLPEVPAPAPLHAVATAPDYAGRFSGSGGRALEFIADAERLYLLHGGGRVPLEPALGLSDGFIVAHPDFAQYALLFSRRPGGGEDAGPVLEAGWGPDWFVKAEYGGPREFKVPAEWHRYPGHYRSEDPWVGSQHVVLRRGRLWLDGVIPLEPAPGGIFYLRDEPHSPEWVEFADPVGGQAMRMRQSGADLWRV
jgi:D-alanyl-D-alanine carboxypeptidase